MTEHSEVPTRPAAHMAAGAVSVGLVFAVAAGGNDGFGPRVPSIDALAGLTIGALFVDRLLTFVPPWVAAEKPPQRQADLVLLRFGYGALLAALFVVVTGLGAVAPLTAGQTTVADGIDRAIAVLAIAGGVVGLAALLAGLNPPDETDASGAEEAEAEGAARAAGTDARVPPPDPQVRALGLVLVVVAALVALVLLGDAKGTELLGTDPDAEQTPSVPAPGAELGDGAVALVVRFAPVILAAAIVEQLLERLILPLLNATWTRKLARRVGRGRRRRLLQKMAKKHNKPVVAGAIAVVLGVIGARLMDVYLLHNVGFFDQVAGELDLTGSTRAERWFDAFATGVVIAAGTKPLHDLGSRLRTATEDRKA